MIYYEACLNKEDAYDRERYLKSGMGKRYLKNRMKRFLSLTGFTLIEIMITTVVLSLLITGIYAVFKGGTDAWTKGNVRMERYQNARAILEMMSREISCAMVNEARKIYMLGVDKSDGKVKITGSAISTEDELFFVAPLYPEPGKDSGSQSDMCELGYWVNADTELMRHYAVGTSNRIDFIYDETGLSNSQSLGLAVAGLRFYYYDDKADSHVNWGSDDPDADTYLYKLPKKIKIVLKTRDEEAREDTQTFETTVFIPGAE